jgi:flagellar biosynthetic protein FlhB
LAEQDSDVEKTLPPSERKLEKAREDGSGLKAPDLMLVISVTMSALGLSIAQEELASSWMRLWVFDSFWSFQGGLRLEAIFGAMGRMIAIALAALGAAGLVAALAAWVLGGFIFSAKAITPDLSRLDPIKKFGQMFSGGGAQIWWPLFKGISALGLMCWGVYLFATDMANGALPLPSAAKAAAPSAAAFIVFAGLDFGIQAWKRNTSLSMTLQELKDEIKESEGDPMMKAKARAIARQRSRSRMMSAMATADVVVVNPEHYLVALRWDPKRAQAPVVVARARDLLALSLKAKAKELGVPVLEAPPFARALWAASELDFPVPPLFYESIATLLAWAFAIKDGRSAPEPAMSPPQAPKESTRA